MKIFTAGCFDCIHAGHFNLLLFCRHLAGHLGQVAVSVDSDTKVVRDKGAGRPIFDQVERFHAVHSLKQGDRPLVDKVYCHTNTETLKNYIVDFKPDYIVVGSDYKGHHVVGSDICEVIYFKRDDRFSTSKIIEACRKGK